MASDGLHIEAGGRRVPLVVRRHAMAKGYRLRLGADGIARLTLPARGSAGHAVDWARGQVAWIAAQLARRPATGTALAHGATLPLEGRAVTLEWRADGPRSVRLEGDRLVFGGPENHAEGRVLRWLQARARDVLGSETRALADAHGLPLRAVAIGDPSSRWGSCTGSGAIRYSWRLILAPPEVRIATVAHEVAHLKHMDHSPAFHAFHAAICPSDVRAARAWLKANGAALHAVGRAFS